MEKVSNLTTNSLKESPSTQHPATMLGATEFGGAPAAQHPAPSTQHPAPMWGATAIAAPANPIPLPVSSRTPTG